MTATILQFQQQQSFKTDNISRYSFTIAVHRPTVTGAVRTQIRRSTSHAASSRRPRSRCRRTGRCTRTPTRTYTRTRTTGEVRDNCSLVCKTFLFNFCFVFFLYDRHRHRWWNGFVNRNIET